MLVQHRTHTVLAGEKLHKPPRAVNEPRSTSFRQTLPAATRCSVLRRMSLVIICQSPHVPLRCRGMKRFLVLALLAALTLITQFHASGQDDQYLRVYNLIQEGDSLKNSD